MIRIVCGMMIAALALAAASAWPPAATAEKRAEKRLALVIGNAAYVHSTPLLNPANDATDMANALQASGFEVILGIDLDKRGFEGKVREFARALGAADVGLLFYAGHALQVGRTNYLLPVDAKLESDRDLEFESVRLELILAQMELAREGKTNIVLLDACRDNPLSRGLARSMGTRSASLGRGLAQVQSGVGTFIAYSTQPDNVALDGQGRNSPFTSALTRHITTEGRNLSAVMIEVRKDVIAATRGQQVPWDHSALTGEFYFRPGAAGPTGQGAAELAAVSARAASLEEELRQRGSAEDIARIAVLRERKRDLDRQIVEARQAMFEVQREMGQETDPNRRQKFSMDLLNRQRRLGERQLQLRQTNEEIAAIEARSKAQPIAPKAGVQTAAAPQAAGGTGLVATLTRRFASFAPASRVDNVDIYNKAKVRGGLIDAGAATSLDECRATCGREPICIAFALEARASICELYKSIDGLQQDPAWTSGVASK
jgi:uncharacterized caspase-like protein